MGLQGRISILKMLDPWQASKPQIDLEKMLAKLEADKRDEETAFWKDTLKLRQELLGGVRSIQTVGQLVDNYVKWAGQYLAPLRDGRPHPDLSRIERLRRFLKPYLDWKVADFGPDELRKAQEAMVEYRYTRPNHEEEPVPYTRSGINQVINQAHKIWQWAMTHEIATDTQARNLREV